MTTTERENISVVENLIVKDNLIESSIGLRKFNWNILNDKKKLKRSIFPPSLRLIVLGKLLIDEMKIRTNVY